MKYVRDGRIEELVSEIILALGLTYVDPNRVRVVRSYGSRSEGTMARIHGISKALQVGLDIRPHYVIEIVGEKFDLLSNSAKKKVLVHELLHIPMGFGGGTLDHGRKDFDRLERMYLKRLSNELKKD